MPTPKKPVKSTASAIPSASRETGGGGTHLSELAQVLINECIILGKSNGEINAALRNAKHLKENESISAQALHAYRRSPAAQVRREKLTEEAQQVGHAALSEAIVHTAETMRASFAELIDLGTGKFRGRDKDKHRTAALVYFKSVDFLWNRLGYKDVFAVIEESEKEALSAIEQSGADDDTKNELRLMVKEQALEQLRRIATLKKQAVTGQGAAA